MSPITRTFYYSGLTEQEEKEQFRNVIYAGSSATFTPFYISNADYL